MYAGGVSRQSRLGFWGTVPGEDTAGLVHGRLGGASDVGTIDLGESPKCKPRPPRRHEFFEQLFVAKALGWETDPLHVCVTLAFLPSGEWATSYYSYKLDEIAMEDAVDWDRWHDLLDIRDEQGLSDGEQAEYDRIAIVVAQMDAQEEAISGPAMEALMKRHEKVLSSIRRLTEAVQASANRR